MSQTHEQTPTAQPIPASFAGQNWLIVPAASPQGQTNSQFWLIVLSGVAFTVVQGENLYTILIRPEITGPVNDAIRLFGAPKLPGEVFLNVEQWAPYAAVGSTHGDEGELLFDIITWRPNPFEKLIDETTHLEMNQIFTGIQVDISNLLVRDNDRRIIRLAYNITLLAQFASVIII
jgi:hypothetical protein